ncbi:MAG TPA: hypothetical protein VNL77_20950 [Roseiflexaceae bacterium]|nr:hypothetical protein [Roseiflexaceae bacterium]
MNAHRRYLRHAGLIAGLALLCALPVAALLARPRAARTHAENIAGALARRGVVYEQIVLSQSYEESVEFDFYRAQVQVHMPGGQVVSGWIGCEDRDRICFLELRGLGVRGERLPDLARDPPWPWLTWVRGALREAGIEL